jgi:hypothetical protein
VSTAIEQIELASPNQWEYLARGKLDDANKFAAFFGLTRSHWPANANIGMANEWLKQVQAEHDWEKFQLQDFRRLRAQYGVDWVVLQQPWHTMPLRESGRKNLPRRLNRL